MFDLEQSIKTIGLWGVFAVVFAETGLLIGFFLPGDSLLFTAGFLASQGVFDIHWLSHGCFIAAVVGNFTGYAFGHRVGRKLFERPDSRFFKRAHLEKAHAFYERHGGKSIVIARFVPIVRTYVPFVAGMAEMTYARFAFFNVSGGILWVVSLCYAGYFFGNLPFVQKNLTLIIFGIIGLSVAPIVWAAARAKLAARA